MNNRWCIIAGARSGSTWLEEMIYNSFPIGNYKMKLGEPLEYSTESNTSSSHNTGVILNDNNCLAIAISNDSNVTKQQYYDSIFEKFSSADRRQPVVMKIFCQDWKYTEDQYIKFLTMLRDCGYKFINLERSINDRATSWWFMEHYKTVHKWKTKDNTVFYSSTDKFKKNVDHESLVKIDVKTWIDYLNLSLSEDKLNHKICQMFDVITVNYNSLIEDCQKYNIPINSNTSVQKLYDIDYKNKISNYMELIEISNTSEFIQKYGKKNSLSHPILNTACRFAWDYPILQMARNDLRNCCRSMPNPLSQDDLATGKMIFKSNKSINKMKRELLTGIKTEACRSCWNIENVGSKSPRTGIDSLVTYVQRNLWTDKSLNEVKNKLGRLSESDINDIIDINVPRMIEISLGNTCDLKCVYCSHHYSSQWASERLRYKEITIEEIEKPLSDVETKFESAWWDWFESEAGFNTHCINFIGGEPLLIDKFYTYVDRIINFYDSHNTSQEYINISLVTNFNTPKKQFAKFLILTKKLLDHGRFKLDFNVSMESINDRAEFIRSGTNWSLLTENLEKFIKFISIEDTYYPKRCVLNLQIALNNLCISDLPNFFKYVVELQQRYIIPINLRQNQISYPLWNSCYILPESFGKYIDESIDILENENVLHSRYTEFGRWDSYVKFLKSVKHGIQNPKKDNESRRQFAQNIDNLCQRRNINFHDTFPELVEFYNECKQ